ncbi:hypothetical protein PsYK624_111190 [Phanerochaete sordida]|uniref:Uncharacterized protein n=1 Tax=Phanerochaete sordida TaxID=48140 RepID=A0A9P3GHC5_9APHY|nr:hypothetical protein PsYK624_111190 [Phanerochaete sordida]
MAAKAPTGSKHRKRTAHDGRRKAQAAAAVEKRAKGTKGRSVKARLEQLTAELDARTAEVQGAYTTPAPPRDPMVPMDTHAPISDLAEALRGL